MNARRILQTLRRRLGAWLGVCLGLWLGAVLGGLMLLAGVADAALDLPEALRALTPLALGLVAVLLPLLAARGWFLLSDARIARRFEQADPALGNRLINAVQLARQCGSTPVEEYLRLEAVALGQEAAAGVAVWPSVRKGVQVATTLTIFVAVCWLSVAFLAQDVLRAVLPRFLDPHGDHPPYSTLHIDVTPKGVEVLYAGQVEVRANASGRPVEKLWLVTKSGTNLTRTIMFLAPDKSFFQALANLREPAEYYVTDGQARSRRFPITIRYTPQITLVELTTTFPQYTGKPSRTSKLGDEAMALPHSTRVAFRVASNRPLKAGQLNLTPVLGGKPAQVTLQPEGQSNLVRGEFSLTESVVFSLTVCDHSGLDCADPRQGRFNLLPDERPRVFVIEPGRDAVATPSIRVPVRVEAQDDFGITRVVWLRGFNRSIERPFSMPLTLKGGAQSVEAVGAFEFQKWGVRPGDVIDYYFEAADNYPQGPNITLSRLYQIQIISQEQYDAILRQAAARKALFEPYFQLGSWLRRLAERARNLEKQARDGSAAEQAGPAREAAGLADDLSQYQGELGKLMQQAILFDVEQSFRNTLVEQHTRLDLLSRKLKATVGNGVADPKDLKEAADELSRLAQTEQEEVEEPGQQIAAVVRLLAGADTFVKLARQQAALAQMLRRFSDRSEGLSAVEQMEIQELAHHQRRVQEGLRTLLDSMPGLLAALPDQPQYETLRGDAQKFLQAVAEAKIESDLTGAIGKLSASDGKGGYPLAQSAADKMDQLIGKCCAGMQAKGKQCLRFRPTVQEKMGGTIDQILAALGVGEAAGQGGRDGYGLFNDDVALYGPNIELAGQQAGGRRESPAGGSRRSERVPAAAQDPGSSSLDVSGRVRLQPNARFPLRYRDLVGEYFRVIAESEAEKGK